MKSEYRAAGEELKKFSLRPETDDAGNVILVDDAGRMLSGVYKLRVISEVDDATRYEISAFAGPK